MIVVDTSALLEALVAREPDPDLVARIGDDGDLHAPHLLDLEALQVLRRLVQVGQVSAERAEDARSDLRDLRITRYPHHPLADRIWALRENVTPYDAAYLALAEVLGVPLVTTDARLAAAPGTTATVEVYATGS